MSEVRLDPENVGGTVSTTAAATGVVADVGQSIALSLLLGIRAFTRGADRVYFVMGYICGLELLFLGFWITYQVIARKVGWVQAPATDVMAGYVLAMAATWSFSYSLRSGSHVRIDALLPFMGARTRWVADEAALGSVLFLASVTSWKVWVNIINNFQNGTVTNDYPLTPLWIPKLVVGIGFTFLSFTALQMMMAMVSEQILPWWHKKLGGGDIERERIISGTAADAT